MLERCDSYLGRSWGGQWSGQPRDPIVGPQMVKEIGILLPHRGCGSECGEWICSRSGRTATHHGKDAPSVSTSTRMLFVFSGYSLIWLHLTFIINVPLLLKSSTLVSALKKGGKQGICLHPVWLKERTVCPLG